MSKIKWLLAAAGAALIGPAPVLTGATSAGADPGTILKFDTMTPVTGPYVGTGNPIRAVPGGGLPWMITAGTGSLTRDGHLLVHVRGLVLADQPPVPPALQGTSPVPDFKAIISCQRSAPPARPPSPTSAPPRSRPARAGTPTSTPR